MQSNMNIEFLALEKSLPGFFSAGVEITRVTPSPPQRGRQHEGASPLDPS